MSQDIQNVIKKINEVNILLNSNMEDVLEASNLTKKACEGLASEIDGSLKKSIESIEKLNNDTHSQSKKLQKSITEDFNKMAEVLENYLEENKRTIAINLDGIKSDFMSNLNQGKKQNEDMMRKINKDLEESKKHIQSSLNNLEERVRLDGEKTGNYYREIKNKTFRLGEDIAATKKALEEDNSNLKDYVKRQFNYIKIIQAICTIAIIAAIYYLR